MGGFFTGGGGATPKDIWEYLTRTLTQLPPSLLFLHLTSLSKTIGTTTVYLLYPNRMNIGEVNVDSAKGTETTETERFNWLFVFPFKIVGTVVSWYLHIKTIRAYMDSTGGQRVKLYVRPVQVATDGAVTDLRPELASPEYAPAAGTFDAFNNYTVNWSFGEEDVNMNINGYFGVRIRTTSWTTVAGEYSGHGFANLNSPDDWLLMLLVR
jgi:hypothetical protein